MGRDKASLVIDGRSVLSRIADAMRPFVIRLRTVGSSRQDFQIVEDRMEHQPDLRPGLGPLSGIHTALRTAAAGRVLVVACDLPFLSKRCLTALTDLAAASDADAIVPRVDGRFIPVCGVYHPRCLPRLEQRLDDGALSAQAFLATLEVTCLEGARLEEADPDGRAFFNLNTPADLARAKLMSPS